MANKQITMTDGTDTLYPMTAPNFKTVFVPTQTNVSYRIHANASDHYAIFFHDINNRCALITKTSNTTPTVTMLASSFVATSVSGYDIYLRVGQWSAANFIIAAGNVLNITITAVS